MPGLGARLEARVKSQARGQLGANLRAKLEAKRKLGAERQSSYRCSVSSTEVRR
jgi:hypothetical protein